MKASLTWVCAAVALAGCGGSGGGHKQTTADGPTAITIRVQPRAAPVGHRVTISGVLTRAGKPAAGVTVDLFELRQYERTSGNQPTADTTKTGPDGGYRFLRHPDRNVLYSVGTRAYDQGGASSRQLLNIVLLRTSLRPVANKGERRIVFTARGPEDAQPSNAEALLYTAPRGSRRYTRVESAPLRRSASKGVVATATFTAPGGGVALIACAAGPIAVGWGFPREIPPCGPHRMVFRR